MRAYLEGHPETELRVFTVWLPMFPRFAERRALPRAVEEFRAAPGAQYWDDSKEVGRELRRRVIADFDGEVAWDAYVLFDAEATWERAGDHVLVWGATVIDTADALFAALERLPERRAAAP